MWSNNKEPLYPSICTDHWTFSACKADQYKACCFLVLIVMEWQIHVRIQRDLGIAITMKIIMALCVRVFVFKTESNIIAR